LSHTPPGTSATRPRGGSGAVEDLDLVPEPAQELGLLLGPRVLVGLEDHDEVARRLEAAVDPVRREVAAEAVEVLHAEALERRHLVLEAAEPFANPVGERVRQEAAVSPARPEPDRVRLEDDHVAARIVGLRVQRRPQPREPAADDAEVRLLRAAQGRGRVARGRFASQNGRGSASA
jgi:hypothetical protein